MTMSSMRKISALLWKQMKTISYNPFIISGLLVFPVMAFIFNLTTDPNDPYVAAEMIQMAMFFIQINVLVNGANIICVMIAEEKEKKTLNVLITSTVSGMEFLISKVLGTVILTAASNVALFFIYGLQDTMAIGPFLLLTTIAILPAAAIGAVVGILCKTQTAASTVVSPVIMVLAFVPTFIPEGSFLESAFRYVFSEQLILGIRAVSYGEPFMGYVGFIAVNFAMLLPVFWLFYKKKGLAN